MKRIVIFFNLILISLPVQLTGQEIVLKRGSLQDVFNQLEKITGWSLNYDPETISNIQLTSTRIFDIQDKNSTLISILKSTLVDFEIVEDVILILPPEKRKYFICGTLKDADSDAPLPYAHVYLDNLHTSWTDDDGYFEIEKSAYKNELLNLSYLGYRDTSIFVDNFKTDCPEIKLTRDPVVFSEEIIIRDYIFSAITQGMHFNGINFDMKALTHELGALDRDVLKSIQFLPGITSLDESASNISIRGSEPDHNLVMWEDVPMYSNGHYFGMISSINPFVVDKLNVYNDVYSSSIDNRIGGVIDIKLPNTVSDKVRLGMGSTFTENHIELLAPLINDKLGIILCGRMAMNKLFDDNLALGTYGDKIFASSEILNDNTDENNSESELDLNFYDVNAKLIFKPTDKLKYSLSFFISKDNFLHEYEFQSGLLGGYDSLDIGNSILSNQLEYQWSPESTSSIHLNQSTFKSEYAFLFDELQDQQNNFLRLNENEISDLQLKILHNQRWPHMNLSAGYILDLKNLEYEVAELATYEEDVSFEEKVNGEFHHMFSDINWKKGRFLIDFGTRFTYVQNENKINFSPRFTLSYLLNDDYTFRLSSGLFNQYISQIVNLSQSRLHLENKIWTLIPEDPMSSRKLSFGVTFDKNRWLVDFDAYYHRSSSVPVLSSGQSSALYIKESGTSNARGLECLVKKRWKSFSSAISYNLGFVHYSIPSINIEDFPANIDQRHNVSAIAHYKRNGWNFSAQYTLRSGLPYSDIDGIQLVQNMEEEYYEVELKGINDQRLSRFKRLDLTIGYRAAIRDIINLDFQLSMLNVFNAKNSLSRNYVLSNSEQSTLEPEIFEVEKFQLGRTPQILFRITY